MRLILPGLLFSCLTCITGALQFATGVCSLQPTAEFSATDISGVITLSAGANGSVVVSGSISNLTPNSTHGFHLHEFGDVSSIDGTATGGHFNPRGVSHMCPVNGAASQGHTGDLGSIVVGSDGVASVSITSSLMSLDSGSADFILGRALVLHERADDCVSQPSGAAGRRLAQCVVGVGALPTGTAADVGVKYAAKCELQPTDRFSGVGATGTVWFTPGVSGGVMVSASLSNLAPGSYHGFHVHALGDISSADGSAASGHFNPYAAAHGCPGGASQHVGDMGNVLADEHGIVVADFHSSLMSLDPGSAAYVVGRAVILHELRDDCTTQPTGNAGGRFAQCVIGIYNGAACSASPCSNGGVCTPNSASARGFDCSCPLGYGGASCEFGRPLPPNFFSVMRSQ